MYIDYRQALTLLTKHKEEISSVLALLFTLGGYFKNVLLKHFLYIRSDRGVGKYTFVGLRVFVIVMLAFRHCNHPLGTALSAQATVKQ